MVAVETTRCERARPPPEKYVIDPSAHVFGCKRQDGEEIAPCPDGQVCGFKRQTGEESFCAPKCWGKARACPEGMECVAEVGALQLPPMISVGFDCVCVKFLSGDIEQLRKDEKLLGRCWKLE